MKRNIRTPFFVVNPKAYLYGEGSLALALEADRLAAEYDVDIFFTAQACDLSMIAKATKHLIVTAQHMDGILPGRGMGSVLPEAIKNAGAEATFLNHAEHSLSAGRLVNAIKRAKELDIIVLVCADSPEEARAIAELQPDIMICEPTSLIGSGNASNSEYKRRTNDLVRAVSPNTLVVQAAGISTDRDVYDAILSGADGTGATSGIVAAPDPVLAMRSMVKALAAAGRDFKSTTQKTV